MFVIPLLCQYNYIQVSVTAASNCLMAACSEVPVDHIPPSACIQVIYNYSLPLLVISSRFSLFTKCHFSTSLYRCIYPSPVWWVVSPILTQLLPPFSTRSLASLFSCNT